MTNTNIEREHYSILFEPTRRLVRITRRGLWTVEIFGQYDGELRSLLELVQLRTREFLGLIDIRDQGVQTREVAQRFEKLIAEDLLQPVRVAVLTTKALAKLQAERVGRTTQRVFTSENEALDWLFGGADETPSSTAAPRG